MIKKTFINVHLIKNKLVQVDTSQIQKQIHFYKKIKNGIEIDYGEFLSNKKNKQEKILKHLERMGGRGR